MIDQALKNRIKKNQKKLKSWIGQFPTNAFRLYDRDLPDWPYIIDIYNDWAIIYLRSKKFDSELIAQEKQLISNLLQEIGFPENRQAFKIREKLKGKTQYKDSNWQEKEITTIVQENQAKFLIRPTGYIDQGLFLDHRNLRKTIFKSSQNKKVLNLFCYTGSFSIHAHLGGASHITSVDLSKTYLRWLEENIVLNNLDKKQHYIINQDCEAFLKETPKTWDIIILDPPTFSNSKKTDNILDIQRDHPRLIELCKSKLTAGGELYFSTNKRGFTLNSSQNLRETSQKTRPQEFNTKDFVHSSFYFKKS